MTVLSDVIDRDNIWMVKRCQHMGLAPKAHQLVGVVREVWGQNLDRYLSMQAGVASAVYLSHPARTQESKDFVRTQHRAAIQSTAFHGRLLQKIDVSLFVRGN